MGIIKRDANQVPVAAGVSNADGKTILMLQADPVVHGIIALDNTTGSDLGTPQAQRDKNQVTAMMAVSSSDGKTPVALYIDSVANAILIKSS